MSLSKDELRELTNVNVRDPIPAETLVPVLTSPPFVPTRSLINIRDVGAVPGSAIPAGRIFRCGALDLAAKDPEAVNWLGANVKRIFDIRKTAERANAPDPVIEGVENTWFEGQGEYPTPDLKDFAQEGGSTAWRRQLMNAAMIYRPTIKAVLEHVRDRPTEPFLFHCTAGRDRTGITAGLLQSLAGTAPDDVVLDYMLSRIGTEPAREKLAGFAMHSVGITDPETPGFYELVSLRPEYWAAFAEGIREEFGGWDGYVTKAVGLSEEDLATIKKNLTS